MSLVHKASQLCAIDQLELFRTQPTCGQIAQSIAVPHFSIGSLDAATNMLEFLVQGSGDQYIDLAKTKLHLRVHLEVNNARVRDADDKVWPTANFLGSLFQQCDVLLNDKLITSSNNMYAYRSYIEQLLNYSDKTIERQLASQLFFPDDADSGMDALNTGAVKRRLYSKDGADFELRGPLFHDLANQGAYLVNNVDVRFRLTRAPNKFCLTSSDFAAVLASAAPPVTGRAAKDYRVVIDYAALLVQKVTLNPDNQMAIEKVLRTRNAIYSMRRTEIKSFNISAGDQTFTREHINLGLAPKYAIVGLVPTRAAQGDYASNPYNFKHYNISSISLNVDGEQVPRGGISCNFDAGKNLALEAYDSLVEVVGKWRTDCPFSIARRDYHSGFTLFGFQIAPELVDGAFNLVRNTNIRLDITFASALPENATVIVWFAYDGVLEIDHDREIYYDFSA
ncbi:MAG TPA: hypothetical protein VMZ26_09330 [Pyrinomonadaceae bacterium]|nr:hypothetical protein [Pyrinomonadaceae bacterium]